MLNSCDYTDFEAAFSGRPPTTDTSSFTALVIKRYVPPSYTQNQHVWFIRAVTALSSGGRWHHLDPSPLSAVGQSGNWVRPTLAVQEDEQLCEDQLVDAAVTVTSQLSAFFDLFSRNDELFLSRLEVRNLTWSWPLEPTVQECFAQYRSRFWKIFFKFCIKNSSSVGSQLRRVYKEVKQYKEEKQACTQTPKHNPDLIS